MRRIRKIAAGFAAVLLAWQPPAYAQESSAPPEDNQPVMARSRGDYDPLGLRFGGFVARPSVELVYGATDNLFIAETNEQSDMYGVVRVRAPIASDWNRHSVRLDVGAERRMHVDFPSDDYTSWYAELGGRLDVDSRTQIDARARAERRAEPRFSPDSPNDARKPIRFDVREAELAAAHEFNRLTLRAGLQWRELDFDDAESVLFTPIEQDDRDRTETFATLRAEYEMSPAWGLTAEVRTNQRDYDLEPPVVFQSRDSDGVTYLVGTSFDLTRVIRGEVQVGYLRQDYEEMALGFVEGFAFDARVEWFPTPLTTVTFTGARSVEETAYFGSGSYLLDRVAVRVDHELYRNVVLTGGLAAAQRDFRRIERNDDILAGDLGVIYLINRNMALRGMYHYEQQDSRGTARDRDASENGATIGLTFAL